MQIAGMIFQTRSKT
ncbi:MAG: DUF6783 domain-containing protein [Anaerobutyricum hallii]|nr:DUF6783 domain-containing protein [Anaerobutyricum hallii]MDY4579320.1 DUF6783 domain-containing protein [Anaerobutyricum hallii]